MGWTRNSRSRLIKRRRRSCILRRHRSWRKEQEGERGGVSLGVDGRYKNTFYLSWTTSIRAFLMSGMMCRGLLKAILQTTHKSGAINCQQSSICLLNAVFHCWRLLLSCCQSVRHYFTLMFCNKYSVFCDAPYHNCADNGSHPVF